MKTLIFDLDGTLVRLGSSLICFADADQLTLLRQKYNFALVSGSTGSEIERALKETGLRALFDDTYIIAAEDTEGSKSSGEPFREIQKRLQGNMVMIGDSTADEQGCEISGLNFIRVQNQASTQEQKEELGSAINQALRLLNS